MSQRLSVEAPRQSLRTDMLNPVLQMALGSLDVQLEEELARYRRQRAGRAPSSPKGWGRQQARKPLDLISVGSPSKGTKPSSPQTEPKTPKPPSTTAKTQPTKAVPETSFPTLDPLQPPTPQPSPSIAAPLSSQLAVIDRNVTANLDSETNASLGPSLGDLEVRRGDMVSAAPVDPYDYLESSEELLRSLSEPEETIAPPPRRIADTLFTPLGIGSVLLLLLSISTLGLLLMNPLTLQRLGWNRQPVPVTTASAPTPAISAGSRPALPNSPNLAAKEFVDLNLNNLSSVKTGTGSMIPASSPLASPQIAKPQSVAPLPIAVLGSPASVGITATTALPPLPRAVLRPQPLPAPTSFTPSPPPSQVFSPQPAAPIATPEPIATPTPAADTAPIRATNAPVVNRPQRVINAPVVPTPATLSPATPASSVPANPTVPPVTPRSSVPTAPTTQERYYVVVNYDSDRTLEQSRQAVPDAFLRRFPDERSRIQVGSFNDSTAANGLVQKLQQQGIPAEVYRP